MGRPGVPGAGLGDGDTGVRQRDPKGLSQTSARELGTE